MSWPQRLVFTHIPKTAGGSISRFLHRISVARGLGYLSVGGASSTLSMVDLSYRTFEAQKLRLIDYRIITGHISFATAQTYLSPATFVTVLRDPRWQLISNYCSQPVNKEKKDFGMSDFIVSVKAQSNAEWAIDNNQTRMLANTFRFGLPGTVGMLEEAKENLIRCYEIVGDNDDIDAFLRSLLRFYGLELDFAPRAHVTGPYSDHVSEEHLEFAANVNALDMMLYEWARERRLFVRENRTDTLMPPYPSSGTPVPTGLRRIAIGGRSRIKAALKAQ